MFEPKKNMKHMFPVEKTIAINKIPTWSRKCYDRGLRLQNTHSRLSHLAVWFMRIRKVSNEVPGILCEYMNRECFILCRMFKKKLWVVWINLLKEIKEIQVLKILVNNLVLLHLLLVSSKRFIPKVKSILIKLPSLVFKLHFEWSIYWANSICRSSVRGVTRIFLQLPQNKGTGCT